MYINANKKKLFQPHSMSFADNSGQTNPFWIEYFKKRNKEIPHAMLGSHPGSIYETESLKKICLFTLSSQYQKISNTVEYQR